MKDDTWPFRAHFRRKREAKSSAGVSAPQFLLLYHGWSEKALQFCNRPSEIFVPAGKTGDPLLTSPTAAHKILNCIFISPGGEKASKQGIPVPAAGDKEGTIWLSNTFL